MTVLVVGAGATGGYFGARLAQAGRDVTFLVRPSRARQLRQRGLRIVGPGADADAKRPVSPKLVLAGELTDRADVILLSVKAAALEQAMADFAPAVGSRTAVVPFLNGMAHMAVLSKRFGASAVLGGVVRIATQVNDDGDIVQLSPGADLVIGAPDGTRSHELETAATELGGAGFDASVSDEIIAQMCQKRVFIATTGALTSLMRGTVGEIVAVPGGSDLGPAILAEACAVAAAAGYPMPAGMIASTTQTVTQAGSEVTSSLSRDVADGRPAEVEEVLADLARRGRDHGVKPRSSTSPPCSCGSTTTASGRPAKAGPNVSAPGYRG